MVALPSHYFSEAPPPPKRFYELSLQVGPWFFKFKSADGVFSKRKVDLGTAVLIKYLKIPEKGKFLDLGCGYGVVGIVVAKLNPRLEVYCVDVNPLAVKLAKENALANRVYNVKVLRGDLYVPVKGMKFKAIASNPPIAAGLSVVYRIIDEAPEHLEDDGWLQLVVKKGVNLIAKRLSQRFSKVEVAGKQSGYRVFLAMNA